MLDGAPERRIAGALIDVPASATALVALAGLPVLAAAWALMSPPHMLSAVMTWDFLFNLSGAWHVYSGQVAHVDFHEPAGQLSFVLTAIGFHLLGPGPLAFLVNVAIVGATLFAISLLVVWRRLPLLPAVLFVVFVCLLALVPTNVGDKPNEYTFAMSYNRYCWGAFSVLALILFVPPGRPGSDWLDMVLAGLLLAAMFYLKITYFAAGLGAIAVAALVQPHLRRRWRGWLLLGVLAVALALAPFNHAYLADILGAARDGAVRSGLSMHLRNFVAASGQYVPYIACLVIACGLWWIRQASIEFPLSIAFLLGISLMLLSQNSQTAGLPSAIVIILMFYDLLRTRFSNAGRGSAVLLVALLVFPTFSIATSAFSLGGYYASASYGRNLRVVDHTNLRGLAVPAGERGTFASNVVEHSRQVQVGPMRYRYTQEEYVALMLEAADLVGDNRRGEHQSPDGIAVLETINPLPFMLGLRPPRGANLWSEWSVPLRPADKYLSDVGYVLIPKIPPDVDWTAALLRHYRNYFSQHFRLAATTPGWILLKRSQPGAAQPANVAAVLDDIAQSYRKLAAYPSVVAAGGKPYPEEMSSQTR